MATQAVPKKLLARARALGRGSVFVPGDFTGLGSRAAIDQALTRLTRAGVIRRIARGLYDMPRRHTVAGLLSPSLDDVAAAVARSTGSRIQVSGAIAANLLGLSTQVPARRVYLTDGTSRTLRVGSRVIEFKHASPRRLLGAGTMAGTVLQALHYLGRDGVDADVVRKLREQLAPADKKVVAKLIPQTTLWMQPILREAVQDQAEAA